MRTNVHFCLSLAASVSVEVIPRGHAAWFSAACCLQCTIRWYLLIGGAGELKGMCCATCAAHCLYSVTLIALVSSNYGAINASMSAGGRGRFVKWAQSCLNCLWVPCRIERVISYPLLSPFQYMFLKVLTVC